MKLKDFEIYGIDVSQYDYTVNWDKVKNSGCHFAMIRAGWGRQTDKKFKENWSNAKGKITRIVYFYLNYYSNHDESESVFGVSDTAWGEMQAENCWNLMKDDYDIPFVWVDVESADASFSPPIETVWDRVEVILKSFMDKLDSLTKSKNGIYTYYDLVDNFSDYFKSKRLWVAWYTKLETPQSVVSKCKAKGWTGDILLWQFGSNGDVDGDLDGDGIEFGMGRPVMDMNGWLKTKEDWNKFTNKENNMENILLNIEPLSQVDPRWAGNKLGTSNTTIGGYGCLITSVSMMLKYFNFDTDPARLNKLLINNGGYYNGNLFTWSKVSAFYPPVTFAYRYNGALLDKIDEQLVKNRPVIIHVDFIPTTPYIDEHWVLVVGKVNGSYIINDPKDGKQLKFEDRYGDPKTKIFHVSTYNYSGAIEPQPPVVIEPEPIVTKEIKVRSVMATSLRVRQTPSKLATYYSFRLNPGDKVEELEISGDWIRIGQKQWCMTKDNGEVYIK